MTKVSEEQQGLYEFFVISSGNLEKDFREMNAELKALDYIPIITKRNEPGSDFVLAVIKRRKGRKFGIWVNIVLLVATLASTIYVGEQLYVGYFDIPTNGPIQYFYGFIYFSLPLMIILGSHELGHYFVARRNGVAASLPFFIPAPTILGTLGAFISLRDPLPDRKTLIKVGAAGPIVGFIMSIIVGFIGAYLGNVQHPVIVTSTQVSYQISLPAIYSIVPFIYTSNVHPVAFAAWVGFLVTAINLFPVGQLDGGHIARGLLGDKAKYFSYAFLILLIVLGIYYLSWIIFAVIIIILGLNHPPPLNDISKPGKKEILVGVVAILLIILCFSPVPIEEHMMPESVNVNLSQGNNFILMNSTIFGSENLTLEVQNVNNVSISLSVFPEKIPGFNVTSPLNASLPEHVSREIHITYTPINDSAIGYHVIFINVSTTPKNFKFVRDLTVVSLDEDIDPNLVYTNSNNTDITFSNRGLNDTFSVYGLNSSSVFRIENATMTVTSNETVSSVYIAANSTKTLDITFSSTYGGVVLVDSKYQAVLIVYERS